METWALFESMFPPMSDISRIQNKLGSLSQDPTTFIKEFQALTIAFDLTWQDMHVVLTTSCTQEEKKQDTGINPSLGR